MDGISVRGMEFCIKCGVKRGERPFVGAVCIECYEPKVKVPSKVEVKQCSRCKRYWIKGEWSRDEKALEGWIAGKVKGSFVKALPLLEEDKVVVYFEADDGSIFSKAYPVKFTVKRVMCEECSRIAGGYFEAIIQLRGDWERIREIAPHIVRALRKKTFLTKVEEKKEGIDLYVGSSKAAYEVVTSLGVTYKISKKLHGMKEGKRLYRTTFSIRLED